MLHTKMVNQMEFSNIRKNALINSFVILSMDYLISLTSEGEFYAKKRKKCASNGETH